jgi:hypothetical protein
VSDRETAEILRSIPGGTELLKFLDEEPANFHDAEISTLVFDRKGPSWLDIVATWLSPKVAIRFYLSDWIDIDIRGFSNQNVIGDLHIRRAVKRHVDPWELGVGLMPGEHEIEFEPIFGAFGKLRCTIQKIDFRAAEAG